MRTNQNDDSPDKLRKPTKASKRKSVFAIIASLGIVGAVVERAVLLGKLDALFHIGSHSERITQLENDTPETCLQNACACATNHYIVQSRKWLHRAIILSPPETRQNLRTKALSDPDLEVLWDEIERGDLN